MTWIHGRHINAGEVTKRSDLFSAAAVLDIKAVWFVTVMAAMAFTYVGDIYGRNPPASWLPKAVWIDVISNPSVKLVTQAKDFIRPCSPCASTMLQLSLPASLASILTAPPRVLPRPIMCIKTICLDHVDAPSHYRIPNSPIKNVPILNILK